MLVAESLRTITEAQEAVVTNQNYGSSETVTRAMEVSMYCLLIPGLS